MKQNIDAINRDFYDHSGDNFNKIPFGSVLPNLLMKYNLDRSILEIGSGPGALAAWLQERGHEVTCLEPAKKQAAIAAKKGLTVHPLTIQEFETDLHYHSVIAISSLIHVPKQDLARQIHKIARFLKPGGLLFVSLIEGTDEGLEDPTHTGKLRFFAKWTELELDALFSPYFNLLESHRIPTKMHCTFILNAYVLKN